MKKNFQILSYLIAFFVFGISISSFAQLSPGDLTLKHAELEGLSNCTKCHSIGNGVQDINCLNCHKEIKALKDNNKGYHASNEAKTKKCIDCHSDHHGKAFETAKFNEKNFKHDLSGYKLVGAHSKLECSKCHKPLFIRNNEIAKRTGTYLGLGQKCLDCHSDYHQKTLKNTCLDCHDMVKFKPAPKFDHNKTDFKLIGAHKKTDCIECHKVTQQNGRDFQQFSGLKYSSCTNCHKDIHENKFGSNCTKCHNENSFKDIKQSSQFNHNQTGFPLEGLHAPLKCAACHKTNSFAKNIKYNNCNDCHTDFHKGEFKQKNKVSDCKDCHLVSQKFKVTTYSFEKHNTSKFPLNGAHIATPCISCHQKNTVWKFTNTLNKCIDCHKNPHKDSMDKKYYEPSECKNCHTENNWQTINFDHKKTNYELEGKHLQTDCRTCHYNGNKQDKTTVQKFKTLTNDCVICHDHSHGNQFDVNNKTDCKRCHSISVEWKANLFDHNKTKFPLDGKHQNAKCNTCHQSDIENSKIIDYKLKKLLCIDCHS